MLRRSANHVAVAGAVCDMRADIAELLAQAGNIGIHYPLVDAGGFVAPHTAVYLYTRHICVHILEQQHENRKFGLRERHRLAPDTECKLNYLRRNTQYK